MGERHIDWIPGGTGHEVLDQFVGPAPAFRNIVRQLPILARTDATVLITGET
jgi:transcriptional regulator with GAF, ATPase, and Fis domain